MLKVYFSVIFMLYGKERDNGGGRSIVVAKNVKQSQCFRPFETGNALYKHIPTQTLQDFHLNTL
jgi:hypothetical protein